MKVDIYSHFVCLQNYYEMRLYGFRFLFIRKPSGKILMEKLKNRTTFVYLSTFTM